VITHGKKVYERRVFLGVKAIGNYEDLKGMLDFFFENI